MSSPDIMGSSPMGPAGIAVWDTLIARARPIGVDIAGTVAATVIDVADNRLLSFAAAAVIVDFARAKVIQRGRNNHSGESQTRIAQGGTPLHDERLVPEIIADAYTTQEVQYSPIQIRDWRFRRRKA